MNRKMGRVNEMLKKLIKRLLPDSIYLKMIFKINMGYKLDLKNPQTFNEKLQWIKLYDRNPYYTKLVDKYEVKRIVAQKIGKQYLVPTYGVWNKFDDIDFNKLPKQFVLKCTHDSGGIIIVKDKDKLNIEAARNSMRSWLKRSYYYAGREWPYKNVPPRIIAEKYLEEKSVEKEDIGLTDYKFYCFNGKAECVMVCIGREKGVPNYYYFNRDWKFLRYDKKSINLPDEFLIPKPVCMDSMFELSEILSKGLKHVRIDFYEVNNQIYFGEYTFFTAGGLDCDITREADEYFGKLLNI